MLTNLGNLLRRCIAFIIDFILIIISMIILDKLSISILMNTYLALILDVDTLEYVIIIMTTITYFILQETMFSTSIGKKIMGLYVLNVDDTKCGLGKLVIRDFASIFFLPINFVLCIFTFAKSGLGDVLTNTKVVKLKRDDRENLDLNVEVNIKTLSIFSISIFVLLLVCALIPANLYIEKLGVKNSVEENSVQEAYLYTRSKYMSDEKVLELITQHDKNNPIDQTKVEITRYYYPSQYQYNILYWDVQAIIRSKEDKEDLLGFYSVAEAAEDEPIPVVIIHDVINNHTTYLNTKLTQH